MSHSKDNYAHGWSRVLAIISLILALTAIVLFAFALAGNTSLNPIGIIVVSIAIAFALLAVIVKSRRPQRKRQERLTGSR